MKKQLIICFLVWVFILNVSGTNITLTADKKECFVNDNVTFHLEINPSKPIGGQFILEKKIDERRYILIKTFFDKPSPSQCLQCAGDVPLQSYYSGNFIYRFTSPGVYRAVAEFGGVSKEIEIVVKEPEESPDVEEISSTTTSTTLTTTTLAIKTTTTTIVTPTTTTETPDATENVSKSTTFEKEFDNHKEGNTLLFIFVGFVFLILLAFILILRR